VPEKKCAKEILDYKKEFLHKDLNAQKGKKRNRKVYKKN